MSSVCEQFSAKNTNKQCGSVRQCALHRAASIANKSAFVNYDIDFPLDLTAFATNSRNSAPTQAPFPAFVCTCYFSYYSIVCQIIHDWTQEKIQGATFFRASINSMTSHVTRILRIDGLHCCTDPERSRLWPHDVYVLDGDAINVHFHACVSLLLIREVGFVINKGSCSRYTISQDVFISTSSQINYSLIIALTPFKGRVSAWVSHPPVHGSRFVNPD